MKLLSPLFGLLALLSALLCLCALVGLNPTLPGTWAAVALLEQEVAQRVTPVLGSLESFYRALLYMGMAAAFAGLSAYLKPRVARSPALVAVRENGSSNSSRLGRP